MKKELYLKSLLLLALLLPATATAQGYDFIVDGIYYSAHGNEASVCCNWRDYEFEYVGSYSGEVIIPATFTYSGTTYTVTSIDDQAFLACWNLTSVTIPNTVTSIGNSAFRDCGLISINIPNSVTAIGGEAFQNCSNLASVYISDLSAWCNIDFKSETSNPCHEANHFYINGQEITNLIIPEDVTSINDYAFYGCSELTSVTIPNSVTSIGDCAFYGCYVLNSVNISDLSAWCNIDFKSETSNPCHEANHFYINGQEITNLIIPEDVTSINDYAFYGCWGITSVVIPNSVTSIGKYAFYGTPWYNNQPDGLVYAGLVAYKYKGTMPEGTSITLREGTKGISSNAFYGCSGLTSVTIPNSVMTIGNSAFYGCSGLTSVTIPNSVMTIGNSAFYGCSGLTSVTIPNSVTSIAGYAFYGCSGLTSVTIPNSVTSIGNSAFYNCTSLTSVTIPNSVTSIAGYAFYGCSGLTSMTIPNSVTSIGNGAFYNCTSLTSVTIPNSVMTIGNYAFFGCSGLTSVTIPNSVTSIGNSAFYNCTSLTSIDIPNSVTEIGDDAFYGCDSLNDVYTYISDPSAITMGSTVFFRYPNNDEARTLHVPAGSLAAYQASYNWYTYFGNIVEMEPEYILATSVELDYESVELTEGETLQLTATVLPEDATGKTVTWTSSDETIATVDENGLVTALATGTATITATTNDGSELSATCVVNVTSPITPPTNENQFVVTNISAKHGDVVVIPVALINSQTFAAFQTDIFLPEGFSIVTDEDGEYIVTPSERLTNDHVLMTSDANNGSVRVLCYTPNALPIDGSEGELFYITIQVPNDVEGTYTIALRNSLLTTTEYQEIRIPDAEGQMEIYAFIPGDVNDSRTVTVTDIVVTAQYVLDRNPSPFIFEAADMNGDGNVTVTDIMLIAYLINHPTMNAPKRMPALMDCSDRMSGEDVTLMAGETRTVSIALDNMTDYTAFQMDLTLPAGLTASNFQLTDRAGSHTLDVNTLDNGKTRTLCYSPAIEVIEGHEGVLLTFDVTATDNIEGIITVDGIELVTTDCQTALLNAFTIGVNTATSVTELMGAKTVARVDYFNLAGQQIDRPSSGVTLVVTTYTDGTRSTTKVIK